MLLSLLHSPRWAQMTRSGSQRSEHDEVAIADGLDLQLGEATLLELQPHFRGPVGRQQRVEEIALQQLRFAAGVLLDQL